MKKIVLMPVKNEAWILRESLASLSGFADHILIADQNSTDGSKEIYKEFSKVSVIENPAEGHSNTVRWLLLQNARKMFGDRDLLICIDADEMISTEAVLEMDKLAKENSQGTISFELPWIQLWKDIYHYRNDGAWKDNFKAMAFLDSPQLDYSKTVTINDHTSRIPKTDSIVRLNMPLIHFQYVAWEASQLKQVWYRASELIEGKRGARSINHKYSVGTGDGAVVIDAKREWLDSIPEAKNVKPPSNEPIEDWHYRNLLEWFDKYGIEFFESLDIWRIEALRDLFVKKIGRTPRPKFYPKILVWLNGLKNKLRKWI